jgi:hypothetical protein
MKPEKNRFQIDHVVAWVEKEYTAFVMRQIEQRKISRLWRVMLFVVLLMSASSFIIPMIGVNTSALWEIISLACILWVSRARDALSISPLNKERIISRVAKNIDAKAVVETCSFAELQLLVRLANLARDTSSSEFRSLLVQVHSFEQLRDWKFLRGLRRIYSC